MNMNKSIFILTILLACCGFEVLEATTLFTPDADTYIVADSSLRDSNFGTSSFLRVKNAAGSGDGDGVNDSFSRKTYLRFDISSLDSNFEVTSASFKLSLANSTVPPGNQVFNVFGLKDGVVGENWGETAINWNSAPGNDLNSRSGMNSDATLLGNFTLTGAESVNVHFSFSATGLVNFLNTDTDGLVTLVVTRETFNSDFSSPIHQFNSKESSSSIPQLEIDGQVNSVTSGNSVPEPSTYLLLGLALLGVYHTHKKS